LNQCVQHGFARTPVVGDRFDDVVLALKIALDRAVAHARTLHDVGHAGLVKAVLGEARERGVEDLLAAGVALDVAYFGHGMPL
jgi:hypothetical protein